MLHSSARIACLVLAALPTFAFAQADDTAVPPSACVKPAVPAIGTALSKAAADKLNTESKTYSACADTYMKARRATADKYQTIANGHINAANAFAAEFNTYAVELDAFGKAQAAKDKAKK